MRLAQAWIITHKQLYDDHPDLHSLTPPVTKLIKDAGFRPKYQPNQQGRLPLSICPLGKLVDMFHARKASRLHDKVYALFGMSSDDPIEAGRSVTALRGERSLHNSSPSPFPTRCLSKLGTGRR